MEDRGVRIVRLLSENVKRIKVADVTPNPDANVIIVGGKNGHGKSSLLDSIEYALNGGKSLPPMPVRKGQQKGRVVTDLGEFTVNRTFSAEGTTNITCRNKDGFVNTSPQRMLDKLKSDLTFDPVAFGREDPKNQAKILQRLAGLDFSAWKIDYDVATEKRRDCARDGKQAKAQLDSMPHFKEAPAEELKVEELAAELSKAKDHNSTLSAVAMIVGNADSMIMNLQSQIQGKESTIASLKRQIEEAEADIARIRVSIADHEKRKKEATEKSAKPIDTADLERKIAESGEINRKVVANRQREEKQAEYDKLGKAWDALEEAVKRLENQRQDIIRKAKYPVEGLAWTEDGVLYKELPFEQASGAEQLRVSVAMGAAMNPQLKVMLIRDGSLLDEESMDLLARLAAEYDLQVWVERVGTSDECSLIMEEGEIVFSNPDEIEVHVKQPKLEVSE